MSYYSKLETIDRANYFLKFEKYIKKKKNEYQDAKNNSNIERLNREISDVHQIMAENINLIMDRDRTMNSINSLSESIRDNSGRFEKTARDTRIKMMLARYAIFFGIGAIILLIINNNRYFVEILYRYLVIEVSLTNLIASSLV